MPKELEIKDINIKIFSNKTGKVTIPLISKHKLLSYSEDAVFDNGKLVESKYIKITCTTIDLLTWDYIYNYKIVYCNELYIGTDIQRLPQYWINAVEYCYQAKTILKNVVNMYKDNKDWETEYRKLPGINDIEINHVKSMEMHEALHYLNMVLLQRKGELNGLYGIMVMHIIRQSYTYTETKDIVKTEQDIRYAKDGTCYLWGMIVTAIVRLWEVTMSLYMVDNGCLPIYWDTDSVKAYIPYGIDITKIVSEFNKVVGAINKKYPKLGAYDYEGTYYAFKSLGAKRYVDCTQNAKSGLYEWESTIAGLPKKVFSGFLTQELQSNLIYMPLKKAVELSAYYFKPNIFIDETATAKLIPKYLIVEEPVVYECIDYKGEHSTETFWPGARLSGIQFAIMDLKSPENRRYQILCDKTQNKLSDDIAPFIIYQKDDKYELKSGRLNTPDLKIYMYQQDVIAYS